MNVHESKINPIAYNARNTDVKAFIHDQIKMAKMSVDIHTHQFNDPELIPLLDQLQAKGIKIRLIVGTKTPKIIIERPYLRFNNSPVNYHSKFIIIDSNKLLWMSGNLTKSSYLNPWETLFTIKEKSLIEAFSKQMESTYTPLKK